MNRKRKTSRDRRSIEKHVKKFAKFVESNDWEGETWNFYIPTKDNTAALAILAEKLNTYSAWMESKGWECDYKLDGELPECEVDTLVKYSDVGYMAEHNKLRGELILATMQELPDVVDEKTLCELQNRLYKGGIANFVVEPEA